MISWELGALPLLLSLNECIIFVNRHKLSNLEVFIVTHIYNFLIVLISKQRLFKNFSSGR